MKQTDVSSFAQRWGATPLVFKKIRVDNGLT